MNITKKMLDAGVDAYLNMDREDSAAINVEDIFTAMIEAKEFDAEEYLNMVLSRHTQRVWQEVSAIMYAHKKVNS